MKLNIVHVNLKIEASDKATRDIYIFNEPNRPKDYKPEIIRSDIPYILLNIELICNNEFIPGKHYMDESYLVYEAKNTNTLINVSNAIIGEYVLPNVVKKKRQDVKKRSIRSSV